MRVVFAGVFFLVCRLCCAQNTWVSLKDSVKFKTDILSISDEQLVTKAGVLSLNEIQRIVFLSEAESQQRPVVIEKLLLKGIEVFVLDKQLHPLSKSEISEKQKPVETNFEERKSQYVDSEFEKKKLPSIGLGIGLDYGGIGARFSVPVTTATSVFLAGGYAIAGFGYNVGLNAKLSPAKPVSLTTSIMYGYNSVIKVVGAPQFDKIYTGISIGLGFQITSKRNQYNSFQAGFILPFRSDEFENDWNSLKRNSNIKTLTDPWPVLITFGYHFSLYQ